METVTLKPLFHREAECIAIYSNQNATLNHYYQKKAGARWSRTNRCWWIPCTEKNYQLLANVLKGKATIDVSELKKYLEEKKNRKENPVTGNLRLPVTVAATAKIPVQKIVIQSSPGRLTISSQNKEELDKFMQQLRLKAYSTSTIKTYCNEFMQLLNVLGDVAAHQLQPQHLQRYWFGV